MDGNRPMLLVAEDAADVAERLCELLLEAGDIEILGPVADGSEAIRLFRQHSPDGAILDFQLPGATGLDVLRAIREVDGDCLVVIVTAHKDPAIRVQCLKAGADHFLDKSTEFERVLDIVREHLRSGAA